MFQVSVRTGKKMTNLKGGVDSFSYFSLDFQLSYFLTRIIPVILI